MIWWTVPAAVHTACVRNSSPPLGSARTSSPDAGAMAWRDGLARRLGAIAMLERDKLAAVGDLPFGTSVDRGRVFPSSDTPRVEGVILCAYESFSTCLNRSCSYERCRCCRLGREREICRSAEDEYSR